MIHNKPIKSFSCLLMLTVFFILAACSSFKGTELRYEKISTSSLNQSIEYGVYTPPNWNKQEKLPLILFLHGAGDDHNTLERYKIHSYFNQQINKGKMPRFILLTPNGDKGFWENWHDGTHNYRDWVMQDILPKVKRDYNTLDCPRNCSLMGISMGGFGALRLASFYKDDFASVSAISSPILSNNANKYSKTLFLVSLFYPLRQIYGPQLSNGNKFHSIQNIWANKNDIKLQKIRLQLIWGNQDHANVITANQHFHKLLLKKKRKHQFHIYQGEHNWKGWQTNFSRVINFLIK